MDEEKIEIRRDEDGDPWTSLYGHLCPLEMENTFSKAEKMTLGIKVYGIRHDKISPMTWTFLSESERDKMYDAITDRLRRAEKQLAMERECGRV